MCLCAFVSEFSVFLQNDVEAVSGLPARHDDLFESESVTGFESFDIAGNGEFLFLCRQSRCCGKGKEYGKQCLFHHFFLNLI